MQSEPAIRQWATLLVAFFVSLLTVAAVFPMLDHDFLQWEDSAYITENPVVAGGLTLSSAKAALTTAPEANWMPATWLAMAAQVEFFGPPPQAFVFRLTSLFLHALAGLLLWLLLGGRRIGWKWAALIAAATFLVHPQRVESVAWISSQKDLWATLWMLAAALCYSRTLGPHKQLSWRLLTGCFFAASLLSKPSGVSAPLLIFLIEFSRGIPWKTALQRTLPYLALSVAVVLISWRMNTTPEMLFDPDALGLIDRITRALAIVSHHLVTFFIPTSLAPELVQPVPVWPWSTGGMLITLGILATLLFRKLHPVALPLLGWLILLIPVSGILPSPMVFTSDRMHHLPSIALSVAIASLFHHLISHRRSRFCISITIAACAVPLILWSRLSRNQTAVWKNDTVLFNHIIAHFPNHALAQVNLGVLALGKNDIDTAQQHFILATQHDDRPLFSAWHNLFILQMNEQNLPAAISTAQGLANTFPKRAEAWYLLGTAHRAHQNPEAALASFQEANQLRPNSLMILNAMIDSLTQLNRPEDAARIRSRIPNHLRQ